MLPELERPRTSRISRPPTSYTVSLYSTDCQTHPILGRPSEEYPQQSCVNPAFRLRTNEKPRALVSSVEYELPTRTPATLGKQNALRGKPEHWVSAEQTGRPR